MALHPEFPKSPYAELQPEHRWLHDVRKVQDKHDLMRFDASGAISANMFDEQWPRYVVKMATGAGMTKVFVALPAAFTEYQRD